MSVNRAAASIEARYPREDMATFRKRPLSSSEEVATTIPEGILQLSAENQAQISAVPSIRAQ